MGREQKLRRVIREEIKRLNEELAGEPREFVAGVVEKALNLLGMRDLQRNTAGGRSSGELEYVDASDEVGFFVRGEAQRQGRGFTLEVIGRGREYGEPGTKVRISNQGDKRDVGELADAIEEEPLDAFMRR